MRFLLIVAFTLLYSVCFSQKITGFVKDDKGNALSFSSIYIKGTTRGTTANDVGRFALNVPVGNITVVCQRIGYTTVEKQLQISTDQVVNFELTKQQLTLEEIRIEKKTGEDPAYEIIRKAIAKRNEYENEVKAYSCDLYTKDVIKLTDVPKKMFGQKMDPKDMGLDSTGKGIAYLSESISELFIQKPDKFKLNVKQSRVSGSNSFGFTFPSLISLYQNNVTVFSSQLNPRGFVSPIADGAIGFYKFKLLGSFFQDGKEINTIQITPRRKFEPLFSGIINIVENDWRIYSADLILTKESQLEIFDTLRLSQTNIPLKDGAWRLSNQLISFNIKVFGFNSTGNFLSVYSDYDVDPKFSKKFFDRVIIKYDTAVSKNPASFWDSIRPVPLEKEEMKDYKVKDSSFNAELNVKRTPEYYDSLNKSQSNVKLKGLIVGGINVNHYSNKGTTSYGIASLISAAEYNFAEGLVLEARPYFRKNFRKLNSSIRFEPVVRYGFSNGHLNSYLTILGSKNSAKEEAYSKSFWQLSGGKRVSDFNKATSLYPLFNSVGSLLYGNNFLKTYENYYGSVAIGKRYENGVTFNAFGLYEDRRPLNNTTDFIILNKDRSNITANYPVELLSSQFTPNKALILHASMSFKPGQRYIQLPYSKIPIGSKYPTLAFDYTKGVSGLFNSTSNFDKWNFRIFDDKNFKLAGLLKYRITVGGFLNDNNVAVQDFNHYDANYTRGDFNTTREYVSLFQLPRYFEYSNTNSFYSTTFIEHHFNGLLTNKIPLLKRLKWNAVGGTNFLYLKDRNYVEWFVGLENIFKIIRLDFVSGYENGKYVRSGIRLGFGGLIGGAARANAGANAKSRNTETANFF